MWERSARHNPLSIRYQTYADNRPVLPQDRAWDPIARRHYISNQIFYSVKCGRNKKYLSSNNIPMNDRLQLQKLLNFRFYMYKILKWAALVPTVLGSAFLFKRVSMPYKILYPLVFYLMFKFNRNLIDSYFGVYMSMNFSYYFHKYSHLTAEKIGDLQDPSKKHFRLDTDVYYRQTINELTGHGHGHDDSQGHGHHDTSTYYGPYPYNDHENLDYVMEIQKKFVTGKSNLDDPEKELILGEKNDVPRVVMGVPSVEDYRNI